MIGCISTLVLIGTVWVNPCYVQSLETRRSESCSIFYAHRHYNNIKNITCEEVANKLNKSQIKTDIEKEEEDYGY